MRLRLVSDNGDSRPPARRSSRRLIAIVAGGVALLPVLWLAARAQNQHYYGPLAPAELQQQMAGAGACERSRLAGQINGGFPVSRTDVANAKLDCEGEAQANAQRGAVLPNG